MASFREQGDAYQVPKWSGIGFRTQVERTLTTNREVGAFSQRIARAARKKGAACNHIDAFFLHADVCRLLALQGPLH